MIGKIAVQTSERCYPNRLKRFFQSDINYHTLEKIVPNMHRATVGNIPIEIIKLFEPKERGEKIKLFQSALSNFAQLSRTEKDLTKIKETLDNDLKEIMPEGIQTELEDVDYGSFKKVYRFGLKDKNNKKIMHDKAILVYKHKERMFDSHGIYAEPNAWYYLQKNMGHPMDETQFTKHYISDMKSGYTMTEFIDDSITKTKKIFNQNMLLGLIFTDVNHNPYKNRKQYDIGGLIRYYGAIKDRTTIKYFKKIANKTTTKERKKVANQLSEQVKNPKTPHRDKIIAALNYYNGFSEWHWLRTSDNVPIKLIW